MTTLTATETDRAALAYDVMESAVQTVANANWEKEVVFLELSNGDVVERITVSRGCLVLTTDAFKAIRRVADSLNTIDDLVAYAGGIYHGPAVR